ncbi:MAG: aldehyde dehydrogenase family protein, partial [Terriglobales bacterium]
MATLQAVSHSALRLPEGPFRNEPLMDFAKDEKSARAMRAAIEKVRSELGREYDLILGGQRVRTAEKIRSLNPAHPSQVVGIHQKAGREHAEPAMQAAQAAFEHWKNVSVEERASLVVRTGDIIRDRKFEFEAWLVFE